MPDRLPAPVPRQLQLRGDCRGVGSDLASREEIHRESAQSLPDEFQRVGCSAPTTRQCLMRSRRPSKGSRMPPHDSQVCANAAEWLLRLQDTGLDPEEPYPDPLERQNAFIEWLTGSPMHVRAFLEIMEVERRA